MKKTLVILITISALVLTNCNLLPGGKKPVQDTRNQAVAPVDSAPTQGIIGSLKDAITAGQAMRCTYEDENGQVTTLVQGQKMKVEGYNAGTEAAQGKGWMVSDGTWMYIWQDGETKGMKYNLAEMKETTQDLVDDVKDKDLSDPSQWAESVDGKYDVDCKPAIATAADFTPPTDVEFQDLSAMMKGVGEMAKKFIDKDSQGTTPVNADDLDAQLEELKKMIPEGEAEE